MKFILAHSGWSGHATQAITTALNADNIYLETSWTSIDEKNAIMAMLGSDRVMLGSDTIPNINIEVTQYKDMDLPKEDLENIFYKVAQKVYRI